MLLLKRVGKRVRYYKLSISFTLLKEYELTREYGSVSNKKPTRIIKEYFDSKAKAMENLKALKTLKLKRGYKFKEVS